MESTALIALNMNILNRFLYLQQFRFYCVLCCTLYQSKFLVWILITDDGKTFWFRNWFMSSSVSFLEQL